LYIGGRLLNFFSVSIKWALKLIGPKLEVPNWLRTKKKNTKQNPPNTPNRKVGMNDKNEKERTLDAPREKREVGQIVKQDS